MDGKENFSRVRERECDGGEGEKLSRKLVSLVEREKESLMIKRKWSLVEGKKGKKIGKQGHHLQWEEVNHQKPQLKKRVSIRPKKPAGGK